MTRTIAVSPAAFGWTLQIDDQQDSSLVFASGATAESAARRLTQRLASAGEACEVLIYLRDGSLAGALRSTPPPPPARAGADASTASTAAA